MTVDRILIISPFEVFPPYWGAANRVYYLMKCLAADFRITLLSIKHQQQETSPGIDDTLVCPGNVRISRIVSFGKFSQVFNPILIIVGLIYSCRDKYSLILAETGWAGLHAMLLSFITRIPYVLDEHNVEWVAFERMSRGGRPGVLLLKFYERLVCHFAQKILCVSEVDKDILTSGLNLERDKIVVIPNGVDIERFHPDKSKRDEIRQVLGISGSTPLILFNGKLDYKPNYEAVEIIYSDIMPRVLAEEPDAKFLVIGRNPPSGFNNSSLIFTGTVDAMEDYINASDVVICPLRSGGGTRFKILEAVACGKKVVSTTIGAEALTGGEMENNLTCVDDWDHFASEIISAIRSDSDSAPGENFINKYSWARLSPVIKSQILS
jgi:glycosyltransferase involved in cell wall biosynthesis